MTTEDSCETDRFIAFYDACQHGDIDIVRKGLADETVDFIGERNLGLTLACISNHFDIIQALCADARVQVYVDNYNAFLHILKNYVKTIQELVLYSDDILLSVQRVKQEKIIKFFLTYECIRTYCNADRFKCTAWYYLLIKQRLLSYSLPIFFLLKRGGEGVGQDLF